jgi:hypothetical protein
MPAGPPILLHQRYEALQSPIVGIQEQLRQSGQLGRPIPPVTAVHDHVGALLQTAHHRPRSTQDQAQVVKPS